MNERLCPSCGCLLERRERGAYFVDACPDCGGLWVERAQLQSMVTNKGKGVLKLARAVANARGEIQARSDGRRCPQCDEPLEAITEKDLALDACRTHGTFFDAGELAARLDAPPPRPRAEKSAPKSARTPPAKEPTSTVDGAVAAVEILGGVLDVLSWL